MILEGIILLPVLAIVVYFFNRLVIAGGVCKSKNRLDGKIAIITGGNTGIGYETALDFLQRGAKVILACRDLDRANKAIDELIKTTGLPEQIECEQLDLADLKSVRSFAERINLKLNRLDLLINNAGIMMCPYWKTKDNFEMQFGTNHLGHFLLTNLLLDLMKTTVGSRIVNVSSLAHTFNGMNWDDLNWEKKYNPIKAYGQSKLSNILFTLELTNRLGKDSNVSVFCLHPGTIDTELSRNLGEGLCFVIPYIHKYGYFIRRLVTKTPWEGAQTQIHCAVSDEALQFKGYYFSDCKPKVPSKNARNKEDAAKLWKISEKMVGLTN